MKTIISSTKVCRTTLLTAQKNEGLVHQGWKELPQDVHSGLHKCDKSQPVNVLCRYWTNVSLQKLLLCWGVCLPFIKWRRFYLHIISKVGISLKVFNVEWIIWIRSTHVFCRTLKTAQKDKGIVYPSERNAHRNYHVRGTSQPINIYKVGIWIRIS